MKNIVLLDGGLGQEVYRRSGQPAHPLWSTKVMMESPDIVKEVHQDFIRAGARVITLNSYTSTPSRLARDGQPDWFERLQQQAIKVARQAKEELGTDEVQIAGCLPPLIGSYTSDKRSEEDIRTEYEQIVAIQAPEVDLFIIETISNIREAEAALKAVRSTKKPVLLSFTLSDKEALRLRSGDTVEQALEKIAVQQPDGLLFNCSFPETISFGIQAVKHLKIPFGGYANGFTSVDALKPGGTVDALTAREDLNEERYSAHVMDWVGQGASIVGGCCEVGPSYISHIAEELQKAGYTATAML